MGAAIVAVLVTDRSGAADADSVLPLLREALEANQGSAVTRLTGALAVSFASVADGVECAIALQRAATGMGVRVGIDVGEQEPEVIGPATVMARQLCEGANGGQILATGLVRRLDNRAAHLFREVTPDVFDVDWAVSASTRVGLSSALLVPADAPAFVNRRAELEHLMEAWHEVVGGGRRAVFLGGEPGVGKTRLAAEVARQTHAEGGVAVSGWCDEDLGVPYQPFAEAARTYLEWFPDLGSTERLGRHAAELQRLVPELAARVGAAIVADPDAERYALFESVVALLAEGAARAPLVLVLEDLQWAAKPTLLLLRHVLRSAAVRRVLVVGTYRDSEVPAEHPLAVLLADLRREPGIERLTVTGLDAEGVRDMVAASGQADHDADLATALHDHTEGNPFFIGEVLRNLRDSGAVDEGTARGLGLPESVREVINRRLGRIRPDALRALTVAAVIGSSFSLRLLEALPEAADDQDRLLDSLDELVTHRLVVELSGGEYAFAHALIRHALTAELGATRRARLHLRVANAIEVQAGDDPSLRAGELALHFAAASDGSVATKIASYAQLAGERAIASLAADDALHWYEMALEALAAVPDDAAELRCRVGLGQAQRQAGDASYRATLLDATARARRLGDTEALVGAALANNRGFVSVTGDVDSERVDAIEAALDAVGPDDSAARAKLLALLALELTFSGKLDRRRSLAVEALAIARRLDDASVLAEVLDRRMLAIWGPETLSQRLAETAEAEALAERTGNRVANFWAVYHRTITALEAGDVVELRRCAARTKALADVIGQPLVRWAAMFHESWLALLVGDVKTAGALARQSMELGVSTGQPDSAVLSVLALGPRWMQGRLGELAPLMTDAVAANPGLPALTAALALALVESGDHSAAREQLDRAADGDFAIARDPVWLATVTIWAEVAGQVDHAAAAAKLLPLLEPWRGQVAFSGASVQGAVSHSLGSLLAVLGNHGEADACFTEAQLVNDRLESPFFQARTAVAHGRLLLATGDHLARERAIRHLELARQLATEHGFAVVEARAVAALV